MKILTICIPCNEQVYSLNATIESCLIKEEDVEILIVNDHMQERVTQEIEILQNRYPDCIRIINKGECHSLQSGINEATGLYFKVLKASDILDQSALVKVLETFKDLLRIQANLDMMVCDYKYSNSKNKKKVMSYKFALPFDKVFQWHQVKHFTPIQCLTLEAVIFKTAILKNINLYLESNDELFTNATYVLLPLQKVKAMCYIDVTLYNSMTYISEQTYMEYVDQCIQVVKVLISTIDLTSIKSRKLKHYLAKHMGILIARVMVSLIKIDTMESKRKRDELWEYLQARNQYLYKYCKKTSLGKLLKLDYKISNEALLRIFELKK